MYMAQRGEETRVVMETVVPQAKLPAKPPGLWLETQEKRGHPPTLEDEPSANVRGPRRRHPSLSPAHPTTVQWWP